MIVSKQDTTVNWIISQTIEKKLDWILKCLYYAYSEQSRL